MIIMFTKCKFPVYRYNSIYSADKKLGNMWRGIDANDTEEFNQEVMYANTF